MNIIGALTALGKIAGMIKAFMGWLRDGRLIKAGSDKEKARTQAQVNENVREANEAVRSLDDPAERSRVRDKFTRRE